MNTMYVNFAGDEKIKRVPSELSTVLPIGLGKGSALTAVKIERGWRLIKSGDSVTVEYGSIPDFCVALGRLYAVKDRLNAEESGEAAFDLEIMIDCSRNAVKSVPALKTLVKLAAITGLRTLWLYIENTYVVDGEPYFGYGRGAYTTEEIRELDEYCKLFGIELAPCMQTLGHMGSFLRWNAAGKYADTSDVLLAGGETYGLIDRMFCSLRKAFSSDRIHIGMDEAHGVGRGAYEKLFGVKKPSDIMLGHLTRVRELCIKHGYREILMWSDMFSRGTSGEGLNALKGKIPNGVKLVHWDYYAKDENDYVKKFAEHSATGAPVAFASNGGFNWFGYVGNNRDAFERIDPSARAVVKSGLSEALVTFWGDNGGEASVFSALPSLVRFSAHAYGFEPEAYTDETLKLISGAGLAEWEALDLLNAPYTDKSDRKLNSASKYLLYNDPLLGLFDFHVRNGFDAHYTDVAKEIGKVKVCPPIKPYFTLAKRLAEVLSVKSELGLKLKEAYDKKDKTALEGCVTDLKYAARLAGDFYKAVQKMWNAENKPQGFEIQDVRLGGLRTRLKHVAERITDYVRGKSDCIPELASPRLPVVTASGYYDYDPADPERRDIVAYIWHEIISAGNIYF